MMIFTQLNTFTEMVGEFLKLTRSKQRKLLSEISEQQVRALTEALVAKANLDNCNIDYFKSDNWKKETYTKWYGQLKNLAKQFPEVPDERLAIDIGQNDFDSQNEFIEAIAQDINSRRMGRNKYHELLNITLFEEYLGIEGILSGTILTFILPKLENPTYFLQSLKKYNPRLFEDYITTLNQYVTSTGILETKPLFELYNTYWEKLGLKKENWLQIMRHISHNDANIDDSNNEEILVDTHNTASHKSADESHVTAFRIFAQSVAPEAQLTFSNQDKITGLYRKIAVQNNTALNASIEQKNKELKDKIDELLVNNAERKARIYNELLKYILTKNYIEKNYNDLEAKEKEDIDKKIDGFIFKAKAAQRYMNDLLTNHKIEGGYYYSTQAPESSGLNMEQMIAACYFATTDSENFRKNINLTEGSRVAFIGLIDSLYDMKRGYDIDFGTDKPNKNIFPKYNGIDNNRCHGGSVNSLACAIKSIHNAYNIEIITLKLIEDDIKNFYNNSNRCNLLEIVEKLQPKPSPEEFSLWSKTNIPPQSVKDALQVEFKKHYEKDFDSIFGGYANNLTLTTIKKNALNNIIIPDSLKQLELNYDTLKNKEIFDSIINGKLPFIRFDPESGYKTIINHYINRAQFVRDLVGYFNSLDKNVDTNQRALLFLANSNLPKDITKHIVIKTIGDVKFTLTDIKCLGKDEFAALINNNSKKDLLDWCSDNTDKTFNLLNLVISKLVNSLADEVKIHYGANKLKLLHIASIIGDTESIAKILKLPEAKEALREKTKCGSTPLHFATKHGNASAINLILNTCEFEFEQSTLELLTATDAKKNTPLHLAINFINISALKSILTRKSLTQAERLKLLTTKNDEGYTPAHYTAESGNIDLANAVFGSNILTKDNLFSLLTNTIKYGDTPLHLVVKKNYGA